MTRALHQLADAFCFRGMDESTQPRRERGLPLIHRVNKGKIPNRRSCETPDLVELQDVVATLY